MVDTEYPLEDVRTGGKAAVVAMDPAPSTHSGSLETGKHFASEDQSPSTNTNYLKGLQLHSISAALCLCLFLTNLEIPIVSTSLVGITNTLQGFGQSSWIVTAYLLTYIGFLIIWANFSEIFGRKRSVITAVLIFVIFSGACGGAQTSTQLIVFRAIQGIGGSGIYAVCLAIFFELVPPEKYASYTTFVSVVFTLSLLLGPILGGVINDSGDWRWIFLLNVPAGAVAALVLLLLIPANFPHHGNPCHVLNADPVAYKSNFKRVDIFGAGLLLGATVLLVTALEEAGIKYAWQSAFVIVLLVASGLLWIGFLLWERRVTKAGGILQPVFPWRFVTSRVWIGMLLNGFFLGAPFNIAIFLIPQRFMVVNGLSALQAGIRLLPFTFLAPIGSILSSILAGKFKIPPIYLVLAASCLQVVGFSLLSTIPITEDILPAQYGYQIIAGFGVGVNISTLILMTPFCVEQRDRAVALGALGQIRYMGGAVGLAVVTSVLQGYLNTQLSEHLTQDQVSSLLQTSSAISTFAPELQATIREVFGQGYNIQIKILIGIAAAQIPSSLVMWQRKQIVV